MGLTVGVELDLMVLIGAMGEQAAIQLEKNTWLKICNFLKGCSEKSR